MNLWAIVPVKPLRQGKSRLGDILTEDERFTLNSTLLGNTIRCLTSVKIVEHVLVVSRDLNVLSVARDFGARTLQEEGPSDLNNAIRLATSFAVISGAQHVLIMPTDLPLLTIEVVEELTSKGGKYQQIVISPDRKMDGTNALLVSPGDAIDFQYGPGSFQKHIDQAKKKGLQVDVFQSKALELDLDYPEDLEFLRKIEITGLG